jgi:hypothetical protein
MGRVVGLDGVEALGPRARPARRRPRDPRRAGAGRPPAAPTRPSRPLCPGKRLLAAVRATRRRREAGSAAMHGAGPICLRIYVHWRRASESGTLMGPCARKFSATTQDADLRGPPRLPTKARGLFLSEP